MKDVVIFDIQRFSIHDGPGIRTTIFFKGCPLRCAWCQNPESHKTKPEIAFYARHCGGGLSCKNVCPENAILDSMEQRVDFNRCTTCGQCVSQCENGALKIIGSYWDADALLAEIQKDLDFFIDSGGGITLSGGEPAMHLPFLKEFLPKVKEQGIHVNMETCGMFQWWEMESLLPFLDLIYYDLKIMDPPLHKQYTGQENLPVLENFIKLSAAFPALQARMPVIPGINDDSGNILAMARFLKTCGKRRIHLLRYHNLGEAKLPTIHTRQQPLELENPPQDYLDQVAAWFEENGIDAERW